MTSQASVLPCLDPSVPMCKSKGLDFLPAVISGSDILRLSGPLQSLGSKIRVGVRPLNSLVLISRAQQGRLWVSLWT